MTGTCLVVSEVGTSGLKTIDFQQYGKVPVEYSTSDLRNNPGQVATGHLSILISAIKLEVIELNKSMWA